MQNLRQAFQAALIQENITAKAFASQRDINPARVSEFLKRNKTLAGGLKSKIFIGWQTPSVTLALFSAHIQDEVEAGNIPLVFKNILWESK